MSHLLYPIIIGIVVSLLTFLLLEKKAIDAKRKSEREGLHTDNRSLPRSFEAYQTQKYLLYYMATMFLFTLLISYLDFFRTHLTLIDVFLYIFLTAFIGSTIIFVMKIKRSILIKVFAAFLYGAPFIFSSAMGFILSYIVYEKLLK